MALVMLEPAVVAALIGLAPVTSGPPPANPAPCSSATSAMPGFDCCLHLAASTPPATNVSNPAQPSRNAADQKEGR